MVRTHHLLPRDRVSANLIRCSCKAPRVEDERIGIVGIFIVGGNGSGSDVIPPRYRRPVGESEVFDRFARKKYWTNEY